MITLSLDVSTTSTGMAIIDHKLKKITLRNFSASGSDTAKRIDKINNDIKESIKDIHFDVLVISKASYSKMAQSILTLEGMLLGIAQERKIPFEYNGDSSWWSFLGGPDATRHEKKMTSLKFMIKQLGAENLVKEYKEKWTTNKKGEKTFSKGFVVLKSLAEISDDESDAFCAGWFYPRKKDKKEFGFEVNKLQKKINDEKSKASKLRKHIATVTRNLKVLEVEKSDFEKTYEVIQHERYRKAANNRVKQIAEAIDDLERSKKELADSISRTKDLVAERDGVKTKKSALRE